MKAIKFIGKCLVALILILSYAVVKVLFTPFSIYDAIRLKDTKRKVSNQGGKSFRKASNS